MDGHNIQFIKYISSKKALYRTPNGLKIRKIDKLPDILNQAETVLFRRYKRSAIDRGIKFELSTDIFKKLIHSDCYYCGVKPKQIVNEMLYNGIDRLDNNLGYKFDNCLACCKICNRAKSDISESEFSSYLIRICTLLYPQMLSFAEGDIETAKHLRNIQLKNAGCYVRTNDGELKNEICN